MAEYQLTPQQVYTANSQQNGLSTNINTPQPFAPQTYTNSPPQQQIVQPQNALIPPTVTVNPQQYRANLPIPNPAQGLATGGVTLNQSQLEQLATMLKNPNPNSAAPSQQNLQASQVQQPPGQNFTNNLGISLEQLALPNQGAPTLQQPPAQQQLPQQNQQFTNFPQQPQTYTNPQTQQPQLQNNNDSAALQSFKQDFQKYLGFPVEQLQNYSQQYQQALTGIQQINQKQYYNDTVNELSREWGLDTNSAEQRLGAIKERFAKYSPEMQAKLDNVEGARLIWARMQLESQQQNPNPPVFQQSMRVPGNSNQQAYWFTESQLDNMSPEEYEKNSNAILQAYANGMVGR